MNLPALRSPSICSRRRARRALLGAALIAAFAWLMPSEARAFERQWHAGASVGYMALLGPTAQPPHGFAGGLHVAYGITDTFNIIGELNVSGHPAARSLLAGGGVGASYIVDILQWVPHIGAIVGAYDLADPTGECSKYCHSLRLNLEVPFGLDYTVTRSVSVGVGGRYQMLLSRYLPVQTIGAFARVELLWGY
jgi:hypothetical protein